MNDFIVKDCTLLIRMSGIGEAANLRELRDRLAVCGGNVLYHHFCEALRERAKPAVFEVSKAK